MTISHTGQATSTARGGRRRRRRRRRHHRLSPARLASGGAAAGSQARPWAAPTCARPESTWRSWSRTRRARRRFATAQGVALRANGGKGVGGQQVCQCPSSGIGAQDGWGWGRTSIFVQALVHPAVERVIGPAWIQRPEPKHGVDRELVQVGHRAARCCGRLGVQRRRWWRPGPGPSPLGRRMITHHGAAPAPQAFIQGLSQAFCRRPRR